MDIIKVSGNSRPTSVAGAIAGVVRETLRAEIQAIGPWAVNQAVKAVAIARDYLALDGIEVVCTPEFTEVDIEGETRTAIRMVVDPRREEDVPPEYPTGPRPRRERQPRPAPEEPAPSAEPIAEPEPTEEFASAAMEDPLPAEEGEEEQAPELDEPDVAEDLEEEEEVDEESDFEETDDEDLDEDDDWDDDDDDDEEERGLGRRFRLVDVLRI